MPPREDGVYRLNSSFAGARALGAPADYPVMLAPGPLLTSRLPLRGWTCCTPCTRSWRASWP